MADAGAERLREMEEWARRHRRYITGEAEREVLALQAENERLTVLLTLAAGELSVAEEKDEDAPGSAMEHRSSALSALLEACPNREEEWKRLAHKIGPVRGRLYLEKSRLCSEINQLERENSELRAFASSLQQEGSGRRYD